MTTSRFCPIRRALPIAWSSVAGFHCGSTMWTRLAAVRLSLVANQFSAVQLPGP